MKSMHVKSGLAMFLSVFLSVSLMPGMAAATVFKTDLVKASHKTPGKPVPKKSVKHSPKKSVKPSPKKSVKTVSAVNPCPASTFVAPLNTPNVYVDLASPTVKIPKKITVPTGTNVAVYMRAKVAGALGFKGQDATPIQQLVPCQETNEILFTVFGGQSTSLVFIPKGGKSTVILTLIGEGSAAVVPTTPTAFVDLTLPSVTLPQSVTVPTGEYAYVLVKIKETGVIGYDWQAQQDVASMQKVVPGDVIPFTSQLMKGVNPSLVFIPTGGVTIVIATLTGS